MVTNILTPEDKKTLRKVSNYMQSFGMKFGLLELDIEDGYDKEMLTGLDWFSNNYRVAVPDILTPIIEKIITAAEKEHDFNQIDENTNYDRIEIEIDAVQRELEIRHIWSFYVESSPSEHCWDSEDEDINDLFETLKSANITSDRNVLVLSYNGSGDSGYLDDNFDNRELVPESVGDWCYRQLESLHGGWEINEGSQGQFEFDLKDKEICLNHTYNEDETDQATLFRDKF